MHKDNNIFNENIYIKNTKVPWKIKDVAFAYALIFSISIITFGFILLSNLDTYTAILPAVVQISLSAITIFIIYLIVNKKYNISLIETLGLRTNKIKNYFSLGILMAFLILLSTSVVNFIFTEVLGMYQQNPYADIPKENLRMISVLAVLIAPVVEEVFFRGFMQPAFVKSFGKFTGIFITAIIFGISHSQYLEYSNALISVTIIGLILGTSRYYTGSIIPGIIAHTINNFFAALALF